MPLTQFPIVDAPLEVRSQKAWSAHAISILTLGMAAIAFTYVLATTIWGLPFFFDTGDEGYYLVSSMHPHEYASAASFNYLLQLIPSFSESRIMDFRFANLIAQMLGAAVLAAGYLGWLQQARILQGKVILGAAFIFCMLGNLLLFYKGPLSISYNTLTGLLLFSATGLLLIAGLLERTAKSASVIQIIAIAAAGICAGLCLVAKFSAFFPFVAIAVFLVLTLCPKSRVTNILVLIAGMACALTVYFTQVQAPAGWLEPILVWLQYQFTWQTKHSHILKIYWESTRNLVAYFQPGLSIALTGAFLAAFALSKLKARIPSSTWKVIGTVLHMVIWSAVTWWLIDKDCLHRDMNKDCVFYIIALVATSECAGLFFGSNKSLSELMNLSPVWAASAAVAMLPFACSFGTANAILFHNTIYLSALFACMIAIAAGTAQQLQLKLPLLSAVIITCLFSVSQFADGFIVHAYPYGVESRMRPDSLQETPLSNLKGVKVTPQMARFLGETNKCLRANGYQAGDRIIALYNMPGVVYALGGKSSVISWYMRYPNSGPWNALHLEQLTVPASGRLFVLQSFELEPDVAVTLSRGKLGFPQNFRKIAVIKGPFDLERQEMQPLKPYLYDSVSVFALNANNPNQ